LLKKDLVILSDLFPFTSRLKHLLTILILAFANQCLANFGGYYRYSTEGGGTILNSSSSQVVELLREEISIELDQRIGFKATFYLSNTSTEQHDLMLAFPQYSYWDIPYVSGKGYEPGNYYPLNEILNVNGNFESFDEALFSKKYELYDQIKLENKSEFNSQLVEYANRHEAESPPSMPFVIWKLKKISFAPNETKTITIEFKRPWFYQDEVWSSGHRTTGERSFQYIFETANTWKNSRIGEFNMSIRFPSDAWDNLNLDQDGFEKVSNDLVKVRRLNWSPSSNENLSIIWKSGFSMHTPDSECKDALYYRDYSWRFGMDGSKETSWCINTSNLDCGNFEIKPIPPETKLSETGRIELNPSPRPKYASKLMIINGFAKSKGLAAQNAKPKNILLTYLDTKGVLHEQLIHLKDTTEIQTFDLNQEANITNEFFLRILDYYPGTRYQDVCIAELWLE
jgi:hypothetical protein